jgi:hypothetical protein
MGPIENAAKWHETIDEIFRALKDVFGDYRQG